MSDDRKGLNALAPWGAVIVAGIAAIYGYGVQSARIDSLEDQVRETRIEVRGSAATLAEIKDTTTVIKTKLEILLPSPPEKK